MELATDDWCARGVAWVGCLPLGPDFEIEIPGTRTQAISIG